MEVFIAMVGLITGLTIGDVQHQVQNTEPKSTIQKKHNGKAYIIDKRTNKTLKVLQEKNIKR